MIDYDWFAGNTYVYRGEYPRRGEEKLHKVEKVPRLEPSPAAKPITGTGLDAIRGGLGKARFTYKRRRKGSKGVARLGRILADTTTRGAIR